MLDLVPLLRRHRTALVIAYDVSAWLGMYALFAWLRYDSVSTRVPWAETLAVAAVTAAAFVLVGSLTGLHLGRASTASLEEMVLLGAVATSVGALVTVVNLALTWTPRSVPPAATVGMLVVAAWGRAAYRRARERGAEGRGDADSVSVLVIGGGEAGRELIGSMLRDPQRQYRPVGILDDDQFKRRMRVRSVAVLGTTFDLAEHVHATGAQAVVIAIPSADAETVSRLRLAAMDAGAMVKVLPASTELFTDQVGVRDIRDVNLTDVLGRTQLDTDIDAIAGYLTNRRVLVTGAGGSIGAELCRQIHRFAPAELMMLDRDESALHAVQLSIRGRALLDSDDVILCDIRDPAALETVFARRAPDVVFHAAALKHLPMLEQYPAEAVKTNVIGTRTVLDAAERAGVSTFVNISTDKAANPCSVLGYSKRIAEAVTAGRARLTSGVYVSVRFGNVLGSRGSVLTAFARQIAAGGPVTVTDPDVTRYFMTIEEACQLVIQAAAIGHPGEALVLDMGAPVKILDVAHQLMDQAGNRVRVEFTGLRRGEKLHEDLFGDGEPLDVRPEHALVSHVPVPIIEDAAIDALLRSGNPDDVRNAMAAACDELTLSAEQRLRLAPARTR